MNTSIPLRITAVLVALAGCARPALSTHRTEYPSIPYEVLFTRNGCEVGRFIDFGRPVYVTTCPSGTSAAQWSHVESCGANCRNIVDTHQRQIRDDAPAAAPPAEAPADVAPAR